MSAVQICNKALIHIGNTNSMTSLTEGSEEANLCNQVYDENRQELLRQHPWGFATAEQTLALTNDTAANNWDYEYQYPNDCLAFLHIINTAGRNLEPPKHQKGRSSSGSVVLWTDIEKAVGRFVVDADDPNQFDVGFKKVLSLLVAIDICMPLTGDGRRQESLIQRAEVSFMNAAQANLAETQFDDLPDPDFIRARNV